MSGSSAARPRNGQISSFACFGGECSTLRALDDMRTLLEWRWVRIAADAFKIVATVLETLSVEADGAFIRS